MSESNVLEDKVEITEISSKEGPNNNSMNGKKNDKKKKIIIIILLIILAIVIAIILFFNFNKKKETTTVNNENKEVYSKYRMTGNDLENFDLRFLQLETNNKNIVYSPLSIKYALAMLSEGAKGTTKNQIDALIGDYQPKKYSNSSNMSFANAMFIRNSIKDSIKESYTTKLKDKYNAEVIYDDFANADNINSWISNKTLGLIDKLVNDVRDRQFYLINALAIDMNWNKLIQATSANYKDVYSVSYDHEKYSTYIDLIMGDNYKTVKFNNNSINSKAVEIGASINNYDIVSTLGEDNIRETITKEYNEWLKSGQTCGDNPEDTTTFVNRYIKELNTNYKQVKASTDFQFYDDNDVKVFAKDLKEYNGTTLQYVGIMPKNKTLDEFIKSSNAASLKEIISKLKTIELDNFEQGKITKITGGIPLFKYDYELNLIGDLKKLGVKDVFDETKSNLSNLTKNGNTFISDAAHKATIEFSNEGIKAAAATIEGSLGSTSCGFEHLYDVPVVEIDLNFDKSYLYLIRDKATGEVWFVGNVYEPITNTDSHAQIINEKK